MNATWTIAQRELTEKRFVFVTAIAFAVMSLLLPYARGINAPNRTDSVVVVSAMFAIGFTLALGTILGATTIGRELSEGRLSFYFARPVNAAAIWFGKLIAAAVLIVVSFAIIAAPALIAGANRSVRPWVGSMWIAVAWDLAAAGGLFLLAHVIGTFVRSRSAWIAFDFVAATVCAAAIWMNARLLSLGYAIELSLRLAIIQVSFVAVAAIAAGAWQVARGRTDRTRSHVELSRFLWSTIGAALLIMSGYVIWVGSVPMSRLTNAYFMQASRGPWAVVGGRAKNSIDYYASFLYNVSDGRAIRVPSPIPWREVRFSADGNTAAWFGRGGLCVVNLNAPKPEPSLTRITGGQVEALSDDGSRAAVTGGGMLTVYDLRSQSSLGSARVFQVEIARFITPDLLRFYTPDSSVLEFDVRRKSLEKTGTLNRPQFFLEPFRLSRDGSRAIVNSRSAPSEIRDARTGALISTITPRPAGATFLTDGRIIAVENRGNAAVLRIMSGDGSLQREMPLPEPAAQWVRFTELPNGIVAILLSRHEVAIDINRGVVREEERMVCAPNYVGPSVLCGSPHGSVVWTPSTGEKRRIN